MKFSAHLGLSAVALLGWTLTTGCGSGDQLVPVDDGNGSNTARAVDQSPEAVSGRNQARSMVGGTVDGVDPGPAPAADQVAWVSLREAMINHVIAIIDRDEPTAMAEFGAAMKDDSIEVSWSAWEAMRNRMDATVSSGKLDAELRKDARFAGLVEPASLLGGLGLLADQTTYSDGGVCGSIPNLGAVDGVYGDGKTGAGAAAKDLLGKLDVNPLNLLRIDRGELTPDPESRLGAYAATVGYPQGTVGNAVHRAIGGIYIAFGTYGEEKIGRVFNSPEARVLYNQPVESVAGLQMAEAEAQYWRNVMAEDGWSAGGRMGSLFPPELRERIQKAASLQNPFSSNPNCPLDSCIDKDDGLYCSKINPKAAFECRGRAISSAQYCVGETTCSGPNGAGSTISCQ